MENNKSREELIEKKLLESVREVFLVSFDENLPQTSGSTSLTKDLGLKSKNILEVLTEFEGKMEESIGEEVRYSQKINTKIARSDYCVQEIIKILKEDLPNAIKLAKTKRKKDEKK